MLPDTLTRRPEALLLDAGDTLLFLDLDAVTAALASQGVAVEAAKLERSLLAAKRAYQAQVKASLQHEDGWSLLIRSLLVGAGLEPDLAATLLAPLRRSHDDFYFWRKVPAELPAALAKARSAGLRLGVVSNSEGRLDAVLRRVCLREPFELVVDSALEGVSKPDPEIWRRALGRMRVAPDRAVYAGDLPEVDVLGARAAGMHGVLVDAFDDYRDIPDVARVRSVAQLVDELLALPA